MKVGRFSSDAAKFVGLDANGGPIFDIIISIPDEHPADAVCTERQLKAVRDFYCTEFLEGLTYSQAHQLLCFRQYAMSCSSRILQGAHPRLILLYARAIAAFISSNPEIAAYAVKRSDKRFQLGLEGERISKTKFFEEILAFFGHLFSQTR